ncbi:MAG: type II toxin-antitoxin system VapC family toxin [Solirubrobacteraceae bacterium]|nr:type II toxin-antitoxin system VapC family toxin [Solirubrobacteraceae bacterium]
MTTASGADVVVYVDSSVLARAYLPDEDGHGDAVQLLLDQDAAAVTGTWTRVEVAGALVRAARHARRTPKQISAALAVLEGDLGHEGPVTVIGGDQREIEAKAFELVVEHGLRAMDAWHLAVAALTVPRLAERGESIGFASRDAEQARVAELLGFSLL